MYRNTFLKIGLIAFLIVSAGNRPLRAQTQSNSLINEALDAYVAIAQPQTAHKYTTSPYPTVTRQIQQLNVQQQDIRQVLDEIAVQTGLLIFPDEDIRGQVTIHLDQVDVDQVLRILLQPNGWAYWKEGNSLFVMTAETYRLTYGRAFDQDWTVEIFPLLYAQPTDVLAALTPLKSEQGLLMVPDEGATVIALDTPQKVRAMQAQVHTIDIQVASKKIPLRYSAPTQLLPEIQQRLTPHLGQVQADDEGRFIVITDTPEQLNLIESYIQQKDAQPLALTIDAKILQITLNDENLDGVDWEAIVSEHQSFEFLGFENKTIQEGGKGLSIGLVTQEDYGILVDALDTVGIIQPILEEKTLTQDQHRVTIDVHPFKDDDPEQNFSKADGDHVQPRTVKIMVRPKVMDDQTIVLQIKPKIAFIGHQALEVTDDAQDWTQERGTITIELKNGATAVIGGLFKNITVDEIKKIPLLGDIPFLGFAFRNQRTHERKTEIIIFITPQRSEPLPDA